MIVNSVAVNYVVYKQFLVFVLVIRLGIYSVIV